MYKWYIIYLYVYVLIDHDSFFFEYFRSRCTRSEINTPALPKSWKTQASRSCTISLGLSRSCRCQFHLSRGAVELTSPPPPSPPALLFRIVRTKNTPTLQFLFPCCPDVPYRDVINKGVTSLERRCWKARVPVLTLHIELSGFACCVFHFGRRATGVSAPSPPTS